MLSIVSVWSLSQHHRHLLWHRPLAPFCVDGQASSQEKIRHKQLKKRLSFPLRTIYQCMIKEEGMSLEDAAPFMYEYQYFKHAESVKGGLMERSAAQAQWNKWLADPRHPRGYDGPEGQVRLAIFGYKQKLTGYRKIAKQARLEGAQKIRKDESVKDMMTKLSLTSASSLGDFDMMKDGISKNTGRNSLENWAKGVEGDSDIDMDIEANFDAKAMLEDFDEKGKKLKASAKRSDGVDDSESSTDEEDTTGKDPKKSAKDVYAPDMAGNKAIRKFNDLYNAVQKYLQDTLLDANREMSAAQACPDKGGFQRELLSLTDRIESASLVLANNVSKLQEHIKATQKKAKSREEEGGGGVAPSLASRDLTAAAQSSSVKNDLITLSEWRTCFQETMDTTDEESYKNSFKKITAKGNAFLDLKLQLQKAKQEWKDARRPKKGGGTTTTPSSKKAAKAAAKPKAAKRKVDSQVLWD